MTDRDAMLRAVLAAPDDDGPRLIMADWLDEHGEGDYAEFIRVQFALAKPYTPDSPQCWQCYQAGRGGQHTNGPCRCKPEWKALRRRERELLAASGVEWAGAELEKYEASVWRDRLVWRRGFIEIVRCPLAAWLEHGPAVVRRHPVREVRVSDMPIYRSGGNSTYYVGGLGRLPQEYWRQLDGLPTEADAAAALSAACLALARSPPPPAP